MSPAKAHHMHACNNAGGKALSLSRYIKFGENSSEDFNSKKKKYFWRHLRGTPIKTHP